MQPVSQDITMTSIQDLGETQYHEFSVCAPGGSQFVDVSLGYRRSTDFDHTNKPGQDYAIVQGCQGFVVGVVADGVSQSFYGHLAAKFVAERLLKLLWEKRHHPPTVHQLNLDLRDFERQSKVEIDSYELPEHLQSLQRSALEKTRKQSGSQAVFAAFVLNVETKAVSLFEVGDAQAVVHCARGETKGSHTKVIQADHRGRWSSAGQTDLLLEEIDEQNVKGIIIKSDGAKEWGESLAKHKFNRKAFFELASDCANYDDVSFVAAVFRKASSQEDLITPGDKLRHNPSAIPDIPIPVVSYSEPLQPQPINSPLLGYPIYVAPSRRTKMRKDWKMFALGLGAGIFLTALGLFSLMWCEILLLNPRTSVCKVFVSQH